MHDDLLTVLDDDRINEEKYRYPYPVKIIPRIIIIFLLFLSSVSSIFSAIFSSSSFTSSVFHSREKMLSK